MITETATVVSVSGSGYFELEVQRQTACGQCEVQGACGVGALGRLLGARKSRLSLYGNYLLKKGDEVIIGIPEGALVKASLGIYLLPLIVLLISAVFGSTILGLAEWLNVLFSLGLTLFAWILISTRMPSIRVELVSQDG